MNQTTDTDTELIKNPHPLGTREASAFEQGRNQQYAQDQRRLRGEDKQIEPWKTYIVFNPNKTDSINANVVSGADLPLWLSDGSIHAGEIVFEVQNEFLVE